MLVYDSVVTGIFGACHLIGWDFLYPSSVEQLLLQIATCSISCVVIPFLLISLLLSNPESPGIFEFTLLCFYFLARVYLLIAIFLSLLLAFMVAIFPTLLAFYIHLVHCHVCA